MTVKHGHAFNLNRAGTDTFRHRHEGGAVRVVMAAPGEMAVLGSWGHDGERPPGVLIDRFLSDADIVVAEGFKHAAMPVIEVYRSATHDAPLYDASTGAADYIALVSDAPVDVPFPSFDHDDPDLAAALASLIIARFGTTLR